MLHWKRWFIVLSILLLSGGFFCVAHPIFASGENWLTGWSYRKTITIDYTKVGGGTENESNFPVLVSLTGLSNIQNNGVDIRFTSSDGSTQLPREIESYSGGTLVAWVKVPTVSYTANTVIYMYYGNSSATEPTASSDYGSQNVWTENYGGVWHMGSSLTADSTSNANNGTNTGVTSTATGKVGAAGTFDGASFISIANATSLNPSQFSVEFWVNTNSAKSGSWNVFVSKEVWDDSKGWFFYRGDSFISEGNEFAFIRGGHDTPKDTVTDITNGWHHMVGTFNGATTMELFMDGSTKNKNTSIPAPAYSSSTVPLYFGSRHGNDGTGNKDYGIGDLDEVRLSSVVRSAGWIATEYNNQSSPSTFLTAGTEENAPVSTPTPTPVSTTSSNATNNASAPATSCGDSKPAGIPDVFQIDMTKESAKVYFTPVSGISTYYVSYATNSSAESYGVEAHLGSDGVQQYTIHDLAPGTTYYFKARAQRGCMPGDWSSVKQGKTSSDMIGVSGTVEEPLVSIEEMDNGETTVSPTPTPTLFISSVSPESSSVQGATTDTHASQKSLAFFWKLPKVTLPTFTIPKVTLPTIVMPHVPTLSFVPWQTILKEKMQTMKLTTLAIQQVVVEKNKSISEKVKLSFSTLASIWLDTNPTRIADVKVKEQGDEYVIISWETNHPATSKVSWGDSYDYGKSTESMNLVTHHEVKIAGLSLGKTYYYEVMSEGKNYVFDARHEFLFDVKQ